MEILEPHLIKSKISELIWEAKDEVYIVTYSFTGSNADILALHQAGMSGVSIKVIVGKKCKDTITKKLQLIPNLSLFENNKVHSKIYVNESRIIGTSCNFGNLGIPKLIEFGIRFSKKEYGPQYHKTTDQIQTYIKSSECLLNNPASIPKNFDFKDLFGLE